MTFASKGWKQTDRQTDRQTDTSHTTDCSNLAADDVDNQDENTTQCGRTAEIERT